MDFCGGLKGLEAAVAAGAAAGDASRAPEVSAAWTTRDGAQFYGDGIVKKGAEETIRTVGRLGREGMRDTDREIIRIMTES